MDWNYGDLIDAVAEVVPADAPALIHGDTEITWSAFDQRTNALARAYAARGVRVGAKVAFYMRNHPAYMETLAACVRGRFVHVNVNYRYQADELFYIFDNSDAEIVVYAAEFADKVAALRPRLPDVKLWVEVTDGEAPKNDFAETHDSLTKGDGSRLDIERSRDDLLFLYTGGTTGMPKGVMWPQGTLRNAQLEALAAIADVPTDLPEHLDFVRAAMEAGLARQVPACPLMHGTGLFTAMGALAGGGAIVTLPSQDRFDPEELWQNVDQHGVTHIALVGDIFAKPMLSVLDENSDRYDVSSIQQIVSSGVIWSREIKQGLLKHMPEAVMADSFGASEAMGFGVSYMTSEGETQTARFGIGPHCKVFTEGGREVVPGSGEPGFVARGGNIPLGYYKDEKKTAETFREVAGVRYSIPGDWCTVDEDGTLTLLGRGSVCINTGGEKVHPEEIEEALKQHDAVNDALVVGVPDDRWGQAVTAVVELMPGSNLGEAELRDHVRGLLAGYKVPKRVLMRPNLMRAPNGKADYKGTLAFAVDTLEREAQPV